MELMPRPRSSYHGGACRIRQVAKGDSVAVLLRYSQQLIPSAFDRVVPVRQDRRSSRTEVCLAAAPLAEWDGKAHACTALGII